jgi:hypothetical protein
LASSGDTAGGVGRGKGFAKGLATAASAGVLLPVGLANGLLPLRLRADSIFAAEPGDGGSAIELHLPPLLG